MSKIEKCTFNDYFIINVCKWILVFNVYEIRLRTSKLQCNLTNLHCLNEHVKINLTIVVFYPKD